ncbi:MAG: HTH-type transcriptional repressor AseR [Firmicutes bacterium ADurb.Bin182]|nr:MAG: HTH-type transcriptional repressor AseR [Firmicutes bacterium ADurb.Bin182]
MNRLTNLFKILSDETRLRILVLLFQERCCVCELCGVLNVSQPKISKGLSKLKDLGIVADERKEKFVYYSLKSEDRALLGIIKNIVENIDAYPQLAEDRKNLSDKEKFSSQCCPSY